MDFVYTWHNCKSGFWEENLHLNHFFIFFFFIFFCLLPFVSFSHEYWSYAGEQSVESPWNLSNRMCKIIKSTGFVILIAAYILISGLLLWLNACVNFDGQLISSFEWHTHTLTEFYRNQFNLISSLALSRSFTSTQVLSEQFPYNPCWLSRR